MDASGSASDDQRFSHHICTVDHNPTDSVTQVNLFLVKNTKCMTCSLLYGPVGVVACVCVGGGVDDATGKRSSVAASALGDDQYESFLFPAVPHHPGTYTQFFHTGSKA